MPATLSAESVLDLDAPRAVAALEAAIRDARTPEYPGGILMGLSGGVDSALLATLVVRALGDDLLHVAFLRERDNESTSELKARRMAEWLDLDLEVENITEAIRERGHYSPLIMRLVGLSRFLNRNVVHKLHKVVTGETPFMSTLRQHRFEGAPVRRFLYGLTGAKVTNAFNGRQLYRRQRLEEMAAEREARLVGAGNRTEVMTGWFVQDGVDDVPISPLAGLYKTQVWQLARHLGVPDDIIDQAPSPDMMRGITDEVALGLDYGRIDLVLDGIDRGRSDEELLAEGLTQREIDLVREMHRLSEWKRNPDHPPPPVDGGIDGGFRVN
ncbi:MAG: NAD(+) synthase [Phycisphaerae bacterium]